MRMSLYAIQRICTIRHKIAYMHLAMSRDINLEQFLTISFRVN